MNANVNIEEVKRYNTMLKQYKDSAAQLNAQKEYISNDIDNKCAELSRELGIEVTRDNLEQVCKDLCDRINTTLASGNAVLNKIAAEKNAQVASVNSVDAGSAGIGTSAVIDQSAQFIQQTPVAPSIPAPQAQSVQPVQAPGTPGAVAGTGFGQVDGNTLPPLFSI